MCIEVNQRLPMQWLCARAVYGYLSDSYQPEYFRYAVFVSQLNIEEVMHNVGRAVLTFSCKPYLYRAVPALRSAAPEPCGRSASCRTGGRCDKPEFVKLAVQKTAVLLSLGSVFRQVYTL